MKRQDWQQVLCRSERPWKSTRPRGWGDGEGWGWVRPSTWTDTQDSSLTRDRGIETAPYSRSSSSYNSLYLLLLNLKEKNGNLRKKKKKKRVFSTWKERKIEGQNINVWHEDSPRKKKKGGKMIRRKAGRIGWERLECRGLTKGLSSLGGRDGRPCFGRLPFGWVNSDPGQERKSSKRSRLKGHRKVTRTKKNPT